MFSAWLWWVTDPVIVLMDGVAHGSSSVSGLGPRPRVHLHVMPMSFNRAPTHAWRSGAAC